MIKQVLEALTEPEEVAVVQIKSHRRRTSREIEGNALADRIAKDAASEKENEMLILKEPLPFIPEELPRLAAFSEREEKEMERNGFRRDERGNWRRTDGRQILEQSPS